jgi:hypothetical protein
VLPISIKTGSSFGFFRDEKSERPTLRRSLASANHSPSCCLIFSSISFFTASRLKVAGACIGG